MLSDQTTNAEMQSARPMYFDSGRETLFGWLHKPSGVTRSRLGIVICRPFGYESMCAANSVRALAEACASAGATVLRFDYRGTGDSSGHQSDDDQVQAWCADIQAAVRALRAREDVARVGLLGMRLGALLAADVASRDAGIDLSIAVAPVVSGRRYVRELRTFQVSSSSESQASAANPVAPRDAGFAGLEVTGYRLSQLAVDHLATLEVSGLGDRIVPDAAILDRLDLPVAKPWADALRAKGSTVLYSALPGIPEMITAPHIAKVPHQLVGLVRGFVRDYLRRFDLESRCQPTPIATSSASMEWSTDDGQRLCEQAGFVDEHENVFAIATMSTHPGVPSPRATGAGVILLNCGANSHVGPNRLYVDLARQWAARGYCVLRLDLQGLGDSVSHTLDEDSAAYPPSAITDIGKAIDHMRRVYGVDHVTLAGICSGAYHALRAATAGLHVNTVLLVNPLTFYWKQGSKLSDVQDAEVMRNPGVYVAHIRSLAHWRKLLTARVNVRRIALILGRRLAFSLASRLRDVSRFLRIRLPGDLGWELRALISRNVKVVFLFARGDSGRNLLRLQAGSVLKATDNHLRVHVIDGADHTFTQAGPRLELQQLLTAHLPPLPRGDAPERQSASSSARDATTQSAMLRTPAR